VIEAYFGLGKEYAMPTDVIAERFDLTNVRVSQIVNGAITKMRAA
jgi:DNA-directed RNA polymerase sigma subunit (sigma70/sigma32)